jgi:hypoxanthine phosphoribosyltransferase
LNHNHKHKGVYEISWSKFGSMCKELALEINKEFQPDCIIGISKGGLPLATVIASIFRVNLYPIRLSYREKDRIIHSTPRWSVPVTEKVKGKKVLLVDDISVSGETLKIAKEKLLKSGANEVKTTTLSVHSKSKKPDFYVLNTDALIIHPWDKWVLKNGKFAFHPEYKQR